jgi:hypothetical protein
VPAATWIVGGAGVLAAGFGAIMWLDGRHDRDDLFASCGVTRECSDDDKSRAQTKLVVGDIAVGAGLVAMGAALWIALSATPPSPTTPQIGFAPAPLGSGGGGVVSIRGAF